MPRLVYATCEPEGAPHSTYIARLRLVEAIERCGRPLLDDLNDLPFKLYDRHRPHLLWDCDSDAITSDWRDEAGLKEIEAALVTCLEKNKLLTEWMFVISILTLQEWVRQPNERWPACLNHGKSAWWIYPQKPKEEAFMEEQRNFVFEYPFQDPTLFPYQDSKERKKLENLARASFDKALKNHLERLTQIPDGFIKVKSLDSERVFDWIVYMRIGGLSEVDIHDKHARMTTVGSIKMEITRKEKLLGLPSIKKRGGVSLGGRRRASK